MDKEILEGFITLREASRLYHKSPSTIQKKICTEDNQKRIYAGINNNLIIGVDCFKVGNIWVINKQRLEEIYRNEIVH